MVRKDELEKIVSELLETLSSPEGARAFARVAQNYAAGLAQAHELTGLQQEELRGARERLEELRTLVIPVIGQEVWDAIPADEHGEEVQQLKHIVDLYSGNAQLRINEYVLNNIDELLPSIASLPKYVDEGKLRLGAKTTKRRNSSGNADRPSIRILKPGQRVFWRYSKNWFEFVNSGEGVRVFNLDTRTELTEAPAKSVSAAQKIVTGGWADALRGFCATLPADSGVVAMEFADMSEA